MLNITWLPKKDNLRKVLSGKRIQRRQRVTVGDGEHGKVGG